MNDFRNTVLEIKNAITKAKSIAICGHVKPDGDCLGSVLSLYEAIKQVNKNVYPIKNDAIPDFLSILKNTEDMVEYEDGLSFDLFISVDLSSTDRLGPCEEVFKSSNKTICIDHHKSNTYYADINLVDSNKSSTCELIYDLIEELGLEYTSDMANNTFIGILTDTNRFMYSSTSQRTLEVASILIEKDIDRDLIMQRLYQSKSLVSLKLTSMIIEKAKFLFDNKLSICAIRLDDLRSIGATRDDLEDKINLIRDIDTVELACLIKEDCENKYDVSFRSKNIIDVSEIALSLGGGGHLRAAGCSYYGNLDDLCEELMERFDKIDWSSI